MGNIYVPESERDTRYYIWKVSYQCRVPYGQTFSIEDLRFLGFPSSMDPKLDREQAKAPEDRMLTIDAMFEYWKAGVVVKVVRPKDCVAIYEAISNHLEHWKRELATALRIDHAPLEDLARLDEFASVVYSKAKFHFPKTEIDSILARRMSGLLKFGRGNILLDKPKTPTGKETKKEEEVDPYPKRQDNQDYFDSFAKATAAARGGK